MKKILILLILSGLLNTSFGQEWKKYLPAKDRSEYTLYDYQKAFNEYWEGYNVVNGKYIDQYGNTQKAYGWKQFKRWEYYWESRVDPKTGRFPRTEIYDAHKSYMIDLENTKEDIGWVSLGPDASEGGYAGIGRLNTIAFHPSDENTFWVGAPAGGIWLTTTGGNDWTCLNEHMQVLGVSAVIIPSDFETSSTIYIGTGDRDHMDNNSIGVLKSVDAGQTWSSTGLTFDPANAEVVNNMLLNPSDNNMIYAATSDGMYKTIDAGVNWINQISIEFIDIEFHPVNSSIIYGSTEDGKIYKTVDAGNNWAQIFQSSSSRRIELAVSENSADRLYILAGNQTDGLEGIYRSDDQGETISLIFDDLALLNWSVDGYGTNDGQAWYDLSLASDPNNADVLYVGGVNTWKSNDGGYTWSLNNHWYGGGGVPAVHADKHYLKFRPGTSQLYECNDGGVYVTNDGNSWTDLTNTMVISQIYGLSTAQTEDDITVIGLQDNGTKSRQNGVWTDVIGGDGMKCIVDHEDAGVQYGSLYYGDIYRTTNYWGNSTNITNNIPGGANGAWVTPYVLDPNDSDILYVGFNTLWKSTDKGNSFESIGSFGTLKNIDVAEANSDVICVGTDNTLYLTENGGGNWNTVSSGLPSYTITDIEFKYDDPNTIWITLGGYNSAGVYKTVNGGDTWQNISSGLPEISVNTVIQNRFESTEIQLYAGTDFGVYVKNGDNDWELYGTDLPKVVVTELDIYYDIDVPENSRLRISTFGRGLWEAPLQLSGNFAPYVSSLDVTDETVNSAVCSGNIITDYGSDVTQSGFIVNDTQELNLGSPGAMIFNTDPTVTSGEYSVTITDLEPGTVYYCRAFAVNSNGTGYGSLLNFNTQCTKISAVPFSQDFENANGIPLCWSEEILSGETTWAFGEMPVYNAHEGEFCAYKHDMSASEDVSLLILPAFDFSSYENLELNFWHIQPDFFTVQDELEVLYKSDYSDNWSVLAFYDESVTEWTYRSIDLPDLSNDYYIAFSGNTKQGKGIGIDGLSIEMKTIIQKTDNTEIKLVPNPTKGFVTLQNVPNGNISLNIFDPLGKLVRSQKSDTNTFDFSDLPEGIYLIRIEYENSLITKKLIIE